MTAERAVGEVTRRKESGTWGRRAVWFLCFGLGLLTCPLSLVPVVMLLGLGCLGVRLRWGTAPLWGIFGVGVLLLPLLGNGALLTLGFITLAVHGRGEVAPRFAVPFTLVVGANVIGAFAVALFTLSAVPLEGRGLVDLLQIARASTPHLWGALVGGLNLLLFLGIFSVLRIDSVAQRAMLRGLWGGALLAACLIAAALLGPEVLTLPNTSDLWRSLGRHSGTFTDPNAFGVATVLLIAILLGSGMAAHELRVRLLGVSLATVWCALAVVSGSRSFFLGLGVLVLLSVGRWAPRLLVAGLVLAAGGVCLLQTFELPSGQLPIGLERLVQSLRFDRVAETFHSRGVFWSIAASVSGEYPWFGVGLGGFATVVEPYAHALGIPLNGWTDNANSYYLGLVAEMGLVGLFAWLISVRRLQWGRDPRGAVWFGRGVVALLVMLIVGPHLDFAEVTILAAVCVAASPIIDRFPSGNVPHGGVWSNWIIAAVIFSGIVGARLNSEQGQFPFERDGEGRFQWTTTRAVIQRECRARKTTLTVRSAHPDIVHTPVRVRVRVPFGEEQLILDSNAARTIELPCALERTPEWATPSAIDIALEVDRGWVPAHHGGGNDYRYLGVQVRENRSP